MSSFETLVQQRGCEPDLGAERDRAAASSGAGRDAPLRRVLAAQQGLAQAALDGGGLDGVAAAVSRAVDGAVLIVGPTGRIVARHDPIESLAEAVVADLGRQLMARDPTRPCIVEHPALRGGAYARPAPPARGAHGQAWIVVAPAAGRIDEPTRLIVEQAAAIVALELRQRGATGETERRLTAGLVAEAIAGRPDDSEQERRLAAFGIEGEVAVVVFSAAGAKAELGLRAALAAMEVPAAVATQVLEDRAEERRELLCAIVAVDGRDPVALAGEARGRLVDEIGGGRGEIAAAVSRACPAAELPRAFEEAHRALVAVEREAGDRGEVAVGSWRDLGVDSLLLSVADEEVLRLYCDRLLGPVLAGDSVYTTELLHSLELFILHHGQWERAARELHCHRHTLRYRMRKVEELTGRDLSQATDRIEFWLALRARELSRRAD